MPIYRDKFHIQYFNFYKLAFLFFQADNITVFMRHLKRHPTEYAEVFQRQSERESRKRRMSPSVQGPTKKATCVLNGVRMSIEKMEESAVSLVSDSLRPFKAIDDPGYQVYVQACMEQFPEDERRAISSYTTRQKVETKARQVRADLTNELSNRIISLKVDAATRGTRSFLGINAQYIEEGKIILRNLANREMHVRHTASNICDVVREVLREYNIPLKNVYSITSDNGTNIILAGQLLNDYMEEMDEEFPVEETIDDPITIDETEVTDTTDSDETSDNDNGTADDGIFGLNESEDVFGVDLQAVQCEELDSVQLVEGQGADRLELAVVRCAAHTLQLGVGDALAAGGVNPFLARMNRLAKALRQKNVVLLLRMNKLKVPVLRNKTRWHSSFTMLQSLMPLRAFVEGHAQTMDLPKVSQTSWQRAARLIAALEPSKIAMKQLQEEQLLMGDFLGAWLRCKEDTAAIKTPFAERLVAAMEAREKKLLHNSTFLAAIYLDPRYFMLLDPEETARAEDHLVQLWAKLEAMNLTGSARPAAPPPPSDPAAVQPNDPLERILAMRDAGRIVVGGGTFRVNILPKLKEFIAGPRLTPATSNVLEWWESQRFVMPELYALSKVALAVPATQVSVERLFSGMKLFLNDQRMSLHGSILQDLMVVRMFNLWTRSKPERPKPAPAPLVVDSPNSPTAGSITDNEVSSPTLTTNDTNDSACEEENAENAENAENTGPQGVSSPVAESNVETPTPRLRIGLRHLRVRNSQ